MSNHLFELNFPILTNLINLSTILNRFFNYQNLKMRGKS